MTEMIDSAARILFWACMAPSIVFVVLYAAFSKWWVTDIGRIIMGLFVALAYITGLSLMRALIGSFPGEDVFRIVGYLAINIGLWHMVFTLRRIQKSTKKHPLKPRHKSRTKENIA